MQRRIPFPILGLALVAFCLFACRSVDKAKWVGTWHGTQQEAAQGEGVIANAFRRVDLIINADGSFSLFKGGMAVTGEVIFDDESCGLTVREVLDRNIASQPEEVQKQYSDIRVNWQEADIIRLIDRSDFGRNPITLQREPAKTEQR